MNETAGYLDRAASFIAKHRGLILPAAAVALIFVVLVPLPAPLMDLLLAGNIALAAIILLTTIHVSSPLEFSVFPSLLLGATLFRLVLNVATTRLILTAGAHGRSLGEARLAAGQVIWAFSEFVTYGSLAVGVILFAILVIIQFIVITKGAARISEVAARFVLDAMPGKQMAIDADLNASLISNDEARRRRRHIAREADFYGAMDGASKFLRGDAVAALVITLVNILGGLYIGIVQYGWDAARTVDLFTRLTIGDGLAAQVPAFIVAVSAALIVSRSTTKTNLGEEIIAQLTGRPVTLCITAVFLIALAMTSLPKLPLLLLGAGCFGLAYLLGRRRDAAAAPPPATDESAGDATCNIESLLAVDPMRIEIGFALVPLADPEQGGDLLERIGALRRQIALELGLVIPPIRVRDNLRLSAHEYRIQIRGVKVADGKLYPAECLAVAGQSVKGKLLGRQTSEPAFGTPAVWISCARRGAAEAMNYTVVEPVTVLVTHLGATIRRHAGELLSRGQVARMLEKLAPGAGNLLEEVTEKLPGGQIHRTLARLLQEGVGIRDLETILEALGQADGDDLETLTECARDALGRGLSQQYCGADGKLWCVSLAETLEETLTGHIRQTDRGTVVTVGPQTAKQIAEAVRDALAPLRRQGRRPVVLCAPRVRAALKRLIGPTLPDVAVLGYNEIDSVQVQSVQTVGIES